MKKILITGSKGFIAGRISKTLKESGMMLIGTSRKPGKTEYFDQIYSGFLGRPLEKVFEEHSIDVMIHCALDKDEEENIINAEGTRIWAEQGQKNNVGLQIFLSSLAADEHALSPYGRKKFEVEKWFITHNHLVFRLGLVTGSGGLFGRIISTVKKSPLIPLIDGGKTLTYLTDVDTLSEIVRDTILDKSHVEKGRIWFLQQDAPYCLVDILREIRKQLNLFRLFIPVPFFLVSMLIGMADRVPFLRFGINANNLRGMRQLSNKRFRSDLKSLGYREYPMEAVIRKALGLNR